MAEKEQVSKTAETLIREWNNMVKHKVQLETQLANAEIGLDNVKNQLGEYLTPKDAKDKEEFFIWFGNGMLKVKVIDKRFNEYEISWRTYPSGL